MLVAPLAKDFYFAVTDRNKKSSEIQRIFLVMLDQSDQNLKELEAVHNL